MIGLEYACNIKGIPLSQLADQLKVTRMTVNDWTKKRKKIPESRLNVLSEFLQLPVSLINKELDIEDKILFLREEIMQLKSS